MPNLAEHFDVEHAVDTWARGVVIDSCAQRVQLDELKDHMLCLVEEGMSTGLSALDAFNAAQAQMGDRELLAREFARDATLLQRLVAFDRSIPTRLDASLSNLQRTRLLLGGSVVCAALLSALPVLWPANHAELSAGLLAIWVVPFTILLTTQQTARQDCARVRRLGGLLRRLCS